MSAPPIGKVVNVDIVVRLRCEKILVLDGKDNMREEIAITLNWVTNGFEHCRVGFLPLPFVPDADIYDGALCQVIKLLDKNDPSCANWAKWKKRNRFMCATVRLLARLREWR